MRFGGESENLKQNLAGDIIGGVATAWRGEYMASNFKDWGGFLSMS